MDCEKIFDKIVDYYINQSNLSDITLCYGFGTPLFTQNCPAMIKTKILPSGENVIFNGTPPGGFFKQKYSYDIEIIVKTDTKKSKYNIWETLAT